MKYYITKNKIESNRCLELFDSKEILYTIGSGDTLFCVTSNKVFFDKIKSFLESEKNETEKEAK